VIIEVNHLCGRDGKYVNYHGLKANENIVLRFYVEILKNESYKLLEVRSVIL
jgi:hypothetical protein